MKKEKLQKRNLRDHITISQRDKDYLYTTVATLKKRSRSKTTKSELVSLGLILLRRHPIDEIETLLQETT